MAAQLETQELSDCAVSIAPPAQTEQHLQVSQLEQGVVLDGTLVRLWLRDIGDNSQLGLVKCMEEEEERDWLEVMEGWRCWTAWCLSTSSLLKWDS